MATAQVKRSNFAVIPLVFQIYFEQSSQLFEKTAPNCNWAGATIRTQVLRSSHRPIAPNLPSNCLAILVGCKIRSMMGATYALSDGGAVPVGVAGVLSCRGIISGYFLVRLRPVLVEFSYHRGRACNIYTITRCHGLARPGDWILVSTKPADLPG